MRGDRAVARLHRMREGLRVFTLFGVLLACTAVISFLSSEDGEETVGAPAAEGKEVRPPPRLVGSRPEPGGDAAEGGAELPRSGRPMPRLATTLHVQDGRPPDHATSYRIQERVWRYLNAVNDPAKRDAGLRLLDRLRKIRKEEGEMQR